MEDLPRRLEFSEQDFVLRTTSDFGAGLAVKQVSHGVQIILGSRIIDPQPCTLS